MVDMPHIWFGTEAAGYEFPTVDGAADQVMVTDGSGQLSWGSISADNDWTFLISDGADTTLQMGGKWGLSRSGNVMYGNADSTHVNFGVACTTGNSGQNIKWCTVSGGLYNSARSQCATVGGGLINSATNFNSTVGGGTNNKAGGTSATVGGGDANNASGNVATIAGGMLNTASGQYSTVAGGRADTAQGYYSFATNYSTYVGATHENSAAFTTSHTISMNQVRAAAFSTGTMDYAVDHPADPMNKILNQYGVSSDEVMSVYRGSTVLAADGRAIIHLPDYFDDINRNPMIQLTGVGSADVVYVAEDVRDNTFTIGGKPGMKVYWTVTAERTDIHAEIARIQTPVVQQKTGDMINHSIDDDAMIGIYDGLHAQNPQLFQFKTEEGLRVHEESKRLVETKN